MVTPMITMLGLVPPVAMVDPPGSSWLYLIGGGGAVTIVTLLVTTIRDLLKGIPQAKAKRDASLTEQRDTAWEERDDAYRQSRCEARRAACEARNSRRLWDYAARLRRELLEHGIVPAATEPVLEDCSTEKET